MQKSARLATMYDSGMISLGKYIFVRRFGWRTRPFTALEIVLEKNIHGSSAGKDEHRVGNSARRERS